MAVKTIAIHGDNQYETFTRTRVACRGIVVRGGRILISHEVNVDHYLIPGGGLEGNETLEECCVREVREETGYIVTPTRQLLTIHEYYEEYKYVSHYFLCAVTGETQRNLTDEERKRGLVPEWVELDQILAIFSRHEDHRTTNEEKRGAYLREYTALMEFLKHIP